MKVLFLGPPSPTLRYLESVDQVVATEKEADFVVSHGYDRIIPVPDVPAINLHISYLPWNRGSDPNLWSVLEGTPSGVTIHEIDAGVDTGPILAQRLVPRYPDDTLRTTYERLQQAVTELFMMKWPAIREGRLTGMPQSGDGSYHRLADRARVAHLLSEGWDTSISRLEGILSPGRRSPRRPGRS